jgi:hypothetical protein
MAGIWACVKGTYYSANGWDLGWENKNLIGDRVVIKMKCKKCFYLTFL